MHRLGLAILALLSPLLILTGSAGAAELVYVREAGCPYCRQWERQIGPIYDRSAEGRRAALRPLEKRAGALADLKLARPVLYTPTFLLIEDGAEIGRIEGYPGEDFFWALLGRLIDKLPAPAPESAAGAATAAAAASGRGPAEGTL